MMKPMDFRQVNEMRKALNAENLKYGPRLEALPPEKVPRETHLGVWRSRDFLVQAFPEADGIVRLSINRTKVLPDGHWTDGITWDELQRLKAEAGFANRWAVEVFPPDSELVAVSNMRHLWLLLERPSFAWHKI